MKPAVLAVLTLGAGLAASCGSPEQGGADARQIDFDRAGMLRNIGENIIMPVQNSFDSNADELATRVVAYCEALGTAAQAEALGAVQEQWRATMDDWQVAEAMLIGPAAMNDLTLRDRIYSWPLVSSCAVSQDVMLKLSDPGYDIGARLNNRRGLDALEYLLFTTSLDTTCPPQIEPAGWSELSEAEKLAARCALAADAAADLAAQAQALIDAWEPAKGNYLGDFAGAGTGGSSFASAQSALNVVSDAMFYIDSKVKDMKLAEPAGITLNSCNTVQEPCLDELESVFAHYSRENVIGNLRGYAMLFHGSGPDQPLDQPGALGFEDFLRAAGADALADSMAGDLAAAMALAEAMPGTLAQALASDYPAVVELHARIKAVTDNLKSQFLTVLGLDIPDSAAGDND
jgi:predicted lipoprotein